MIFAHPFRRHLPSTKHDCRFASYFIILAVGSSARIFGLISQFVVLIILSRILSKANFGDLMTAFGFYRLAATALGVAGSLVLLFHVARRPDNTAAEITLHRYSALLGGALSAVFALGGSLAATQIAAALNKPGLAFWFQTLAPFTVFSTLLIISTGPLEGRSRISESIAVGEVAPNALRIFLLPIVAWLDLPPSYLAHAITISVLLPWLWSVRRLCDQSVAGIKKWTRWDFTYSAKFVVATLFANQLGAVDILVAGALLPSQVVADYALAARIAALYGFFQIILLKRFAPRAAPLLAADDRHSLCREVNLCRHLMISCGALSISGILFVSPFLLPLFGSYASAQFFLVWLSIPSYVLSLCGASDRLLIIAGRPNVPLLATTLSFTILTVTPFFVTPWIGALSIPAAMIASALLVCPIVLARARLALSIPTVCWPDIAVVAAGTATLFLYAIDGGVILRLAACALLLASSAYNALRAAE